MIVFHEGLPGAGKSYEACQFHILPAIKNGRKVITNIEGINHQKFAELSGIPLNLVKTILVCISHEDEPDIDKRVELQKASLLAETQKDSLVVIDEIQDLFPSDRKKLPVEWSQYIASHRHEGLDIILMGQHFGDVHAMWRRRTQRKIVFIKQTALGRDSNYTWQAFEAQTGEKFKLISSGGRKYDSKYFGLYNSHTTGTENTEVYKDTRTVIWKTPAFKYGIPLVFVAAFYSLGWLYSFFNGDKPITGVSAPPVATQAARPPQPPQGQKRVEQGAATRQPPARPQPSPEPEFVPIDAFDDLANKYRPRLAGVIQGAEKLMVRVEILDSSYHRQDVFDQDALKSMGWSLAYSPAGLLLKKANRTYLVRSWPVDSWGQVSEGTRSGLTGANAAGVSTSKTVQRSDNVVLIESKGQTRMVPSERRTGNSGV